MHQPSEMIHESLVDWCCHCRQVVKGSRIPSSRPRDCLGLSRVDNWFGVFMTGFMISGLREISDIEGSLVEKLPIYERHRTVKE